MRLGGDFFAAFAACFAACFGEDVFAFTDAFEVPLAVDVGAGPTGPLPESTACSIVFL